MLGVSHRSLACRSRACRQPQSCVVKVDGNTRKNTCVKKTTSMGTALVPNSYQFLDAFINAANRRTFGRRLVPTPSKLVWVMWMGLIKISNLITFGLCSTKTVVVYVDWTLQAFDFMPNSKRSPSMVWINEMLGACCPTLPTWNTAWQTVTKRDRPWQGVPVFL